MLDTILGRRSIRRFADRPVEEEKLRLMLRCAMQAPSAKNEQPWEFLVVTDRTVLAQLAQTDPYSKAMQNAPVGVVLLCNHAYFAQGEDAFWQQDMAAAAQNLILAAADQGLGTTWLAVAPLDERVSYVRTVLDLPEGVVPFAMMPVGYPLQEKAPDDRFKEERVFYERYPR